jgi:exonuclease VII large subunit
VVQRDGGDVVTSVAGVSGGTALSIRVADGRIAATTTAVEAATIEEDHG